MKKFIARVLIVTCLAVFGYFLLSLVSAISQLASFVDRSLPGSSVWIFWGLMLFFLALLATPLYAFFRLPKPPLPPADDDPASKKAFLEELRKHLKRNPLLADMELASLDAIEPALARIGKEADSVIKNTASSVFLSTAVMQNGRLDALLVLVCQLRMVWRLAAIFHGRPSPRQMLYLYGNVASNVLIADNIQQIDFAAITTPIIVAIFPSIHGSFPGLQGISTLLINSLTNGAANSFLTLRVGLIAKAYCMALSTPQKEMVRTRATSESLKLVNGIVTALGKQVAERVWDTVSSAPGVMLHGAAKSFKGAARKTVKVTTDTAKTVGENISVGLDASGEALQGAKIAVTKNVKDAVEMAGSVKNGVVHGVKDAVGKASRYFQKA